MTDPFVTQATFSLVRCGLPRPPPPLPPLGGHALALSRCHEAAGMKRGGAPPPPPPPKGVDNVGDSDNATPRKADGPRGGERELRGAGVKLAQFLRETGTSLALFVLLFVFVSQKDDLKDPSSSVQFPAKDMLELEFLK